jgi:hypothetical protein
MEVEEYIQNYHTQLNDKKILLAYGGDIKNGMTASLIKIVDTSLIDETNYLLKRKVSQIIVECIQNIEKYSVSLNDSMRKASFVVVKNEGIYQVSFCNPISNTVINTLKERIENINSLNRSELSDYYKKCLRNNTINDKGGAGLGLIEISRQSGAKIQYEFESIDDENSNFSLMVTIN